MGKKSVSEQVHSWAGWIPTVSGQLSFSIIGHSSAARNCAFVNEILPNQAAAAPVRYVALHQYRMAPDYPSFDFITRWLRPGAGYDFICTGQTAEADIQVMLPRNAEGEPRVKAVPNAQGVLAGRVYILLYDKDKDQRKANAAFIQGLQNSIWLANADNIAEKQGEIAATLGNRKRSALPVLAADFQLYRTGEFRLKIQEREWRRVVGSSDLKEALKVVPNQIYYFVKDIVHRHYHHDGSSDQLLSLTRLTKASAINEIAWRRHTLWGLVRVIMQYRRAGHWPDLQKAKGVIAYAEAFQLSFANCIRVPFGPQKFKPTSELGTYDFKHIRDSIEVSITENAAQRSAVWQGVALALPLILAVLIARSSFGAKLLSIRLAACSPARESSFWFGLRNQMGCVETARDSLNFWESLAGKHPAAILGAICVLVTIFAQRFLLDTPFGRSRFGQRWQSFRSTALLMVYAFHAQVLFKARTGSALMRWVNNQLPPAMLVGVLAGAFAALIWLLRTL